MNFIDLHTHWLPGVDDGPDSVQGTVEMLGLAHSRGTRGIVATPHMFMPSFSLRAVDRARWVFDRTLKRLQAYAEEPETAFLGEMELFLGAENYVGAEFLEALAEKAVLTINESRYLLMEFSPYTTRDVAFSAAQAVLDAGLVPLLAHVERYAFLLDNPKELHEFVHAGCLAQVNGRAFNRPDTGRARRAVSYWLTHGLIAVVASDGHGATDRAVEVMAAAGQISSQFTSHVASMLLQDNPAKILADQPVVEVRAPKKGLFGGRFFR